VTVHWDGTVIRLEGDCRVEEAETLVGLCRDHPGAAVSLEACEDLHAAVLQALLSLRPDLAAMPPDPMLRTFMSALEHRL
jgi:hypothetical protein